MRVLIGWLILLALFGLAAVLHGRWTGGVRQERERIYTERDDGVEPGFETSGRARLWIGRPSGRPPLEVEPAPPPAGNAPPRLSAEVETASPVDEAEAPPDWRPPVYEMTVQGGQVLSVICEQFYGTSRPPLPELVAAYNGLSDADSLRAGQKLLLPPIEELRASEP